MPSWVANFSYGTVLAAGIGAFIANFAAEWIKALVRKSQLVEVNRDQDLASLLKSVEELQTIAEEFWSKSAADLGVRDAILRAKIISKQTHVLNLVASLFTGPLKYDCDAAFTPVMTALSGGDFGDADRAAAPEFLTDIFQHSQAFSQLAILRRRGLPRGVLA